MPLGIFRGAALLACHISPSPGGDDWIWYARHTNHAALEQQFFDVAQAELESEIPVHCVADNRCWEPVAGVERFRLIHWDILRDELSNVTVPGHDQQLWIPL